jgi:hypothetical protein
MFCQILYLFVKSNKFGVDFIGGTTTRKEQYINARTGVGRYTTNRNSPKADRKNTLLPQKYSRLSFADT